MGGLGVLEEVAGCASQERGDHRLFVGKRGEHQDPRVGEALAHGGHAVDAGHAGQLDVEEQDVAGLLLERRERLLDGRVGADAAQALGAIEDRTEALADQPLVLDEGHSNPVFVSHRPRPILLS